MKYLILFLSLFLVAAQAKSPEEVVSVDITCYDTDTLLKTLSETYREYPMIMGITNDRAISTMSVWANPIDKSWTIVATKSNISCIIGTGTEFDLVPYKKKKEI